MDSWLLAGDVLAAGSILHSVLILGQIVPYLPQFHHMIKTRDSSGFSTAVPMVIISASLLRLLFWSSLHRLGKPFSLVLVAQSLVMIATQLTLIHVCVRYMRPQDRDNVWEECCAWDSVLVYCTV